MCMGASEHGGRGRRREHSSQTSHWVRNWMWVLSHPTTHEIMTQTQTKSRMLYWMSHLGAPAVHDFLKNIHHWFTEEQTHSQVRYFHHFLKKSSLCLRHSHFTGKYCTLFLYFVYIMDPVTILKVIIAQQFSAMEREVREKQTDGRRKKEFL